MLLRIFAGLRGEVFTSARDESLFFYELARSAKELSALVTLGTYAHLPRAPIALTENACVRACAASSESDQTLHTELKVLADLGLHFSEKIAAFNEGRSQRAPLITLFNGKRRVARASCLTAPRRSVLAAQPAAGRRGYRVGARGREGARATLSRPLGVSGLRALRAPGRPHSHQRELPPLRGV